MTDIPSSRRIEEAKFQIWGQRFLAYRQDRDRIADLEHKLGVVRAELEETHRLLAQIRLAQLDEEQRREGS